MKKGMSLVLALVMCLSLCACGKSKAAKECENLINVIGEISIDSKGAIEAAEKAYAALTSDEKDSISESAVALEVARSAYIFELSKAAYQNINNQIYNYSGQRARNNSIIASAKFVLPEDFDYDAYEKFRCTKIEEKPEESNDETEIDASQVPDNDPELPF